jgi:uncharacterized protein (TIGR02808 family)
MSTLESVFWHILGYSAIPVIFIVGIFISSLIFFILLKLIGRNNDE